MIIVFVGLRKGNCRNGRNIATVLRAVVKSHNRRKGAKLAKFAKSSKFAVKLQHVMGL